MTNQQKQAQKPLANTLTRETARNNIRKHKPSLSADEVAAIKKFQNRLDEALLDLKDSLGLTNEAIYELLSPILSGANIISKIGVPPGCVDRRHVTWKLMVAMRRVFGISIDKMIDGCFQNLPPRQPLTK